MDKVFSRSVFCTIRRVVMQIDYFYVRNDTTVRPQFNVVLYLIKIKMNKKGERERGGGRTKKERMERKKNERIS